MNDYVNNPPFKICYLHKCIIVAHFYNSCIFRKNTCIIFQCNNTKLNVIKFCILIS